MFFLRSLLVFSASTFFLVQALSIERQKAAGESVQNEKSLTTRPISSKGYRLRKKHVDDFWKGDKAEQKRNKPDERTKAKTEFGRRRFSSGFRDGTSEEEYDYFYEYESSDYRKESRSSVATIPGAEIRSRVSKRDPKNFSCSGEFNGTYPDPDSCDEYLVCVSGEGIPERCPEGLRFDLSTKRCGLPDNSVCSYTCPEEEGLFGIPGDCAGYFRCKGGYPRYETCPLDRRWDSRREICVERGISPCPMKCTTDERVKPYEGDCESYVVCEGDEARHRRCPRGARFDPEKSECVPDRGLPPCVSDYKWAWKKSPEVPFERCRDSDSDCES